MLFILFVPLVVIGVVTAVVLQRRYGRVEPHRLLRGLALGLAATFTVFAGLFLVAETVDDPGGAVALALIVAWLVPLVAMAVVAWWWPKVAAPVLALLVGAVVAAGAWYAVAPDWWRAFEDDRGPVRAVAVFALSLPLALLAWHRPVPGAALLITVGVVPGLLALVAAGDRGAGAATVAVSSPTALVGLLYLAAEWSRPHAGPEAAAASG